MSEGPDWRRLGAWLLCLVTAGVQAAPAVMHHQLSVTLAPLAGELLAEDQIELPQPVAQWEFALHCALTPQVAAGQLEALGALAGLPSWCGYRVTLPEPATRVALNYQGKLVAPPADPQALYATPGHIGPEGVFLSAASGWYPQPLVGSDYLTFDLELTLPSGWQGVSAGEEQPHGWREREPQEEIALVANRFQSYRRATPWGEAQVWLLTADEALAERYLAATERYLGLYSRLLGPYPYPKFALVENFWQSGYGFPSFTLLGGRLLRLPFIIDSSYPHEVLHDWWGNGVYVDYASGNWSEGLTAYLADHLLAAQAGGGARYRRDLLHKYAAFAQEAGALPLVEFRSRHSSASQAVGYGKGAMLFHMLRLELGDATFIGALRRLYTSQRFQRTDWATLARVFEDSSGRSLGPFFEQWVERAGAPELRLTAAAASETATGWQVAFTLQQVQGGAPYRLRVPVAVQLAQGPPLERSVELVSEEGQFVIELAERPLRLAVDPRFDLFRQLLPEELPPALDGLFAAEGGVAVVPAAAAAPLQAGYRALAEALGAQRVVKDSELTTLPAGQPVWLLGWENRFLAEGLQGSGVAAKGAQVALGEAVLERSVASLALVRPLPGGPVGVVASGQIDALPGLARKLPHYGKYGYLLFSGAAPDNVVKGQWPTADSPLSVRLQEGTLPPLALPPRLGELEEAR